jgi:hypothetical protein
MPTAQSKSRQDDDRNLVAQQKAEDKSVSDDPGQRRPLVAASDLEEAPEMYTVEVAVPLDLTGIGLATHWHPRGLCIDSIPQSQNSSILCKANVQEGHIITAINSHSLDSIELADLDDDARLAGLQQYICSLHMTGDKGGACLKLTVINTSMNTSHFTGVGNNAEHTVVPRNNAVTGQRPPQLTINLNGKLQPDTGSDCPKAFMCCWIATGCKAKSLSVCNNKLSPKYSHALCLALQAPLSSIVQVNCC